jgi:hypothetical protein
MGFAEDEPRRTSFRWLLSILAVDLLRASHMAFFIRGRGVNLNFALEICAFLNSCSFV